MHIISSALDIPTAAYMCPYIYIYISQENLDEIRA